MILLRCPSCQAVFRVTDAQLSARNGRVRCGKCATVFNGFEHTLAAPVHAEPVSTEPAEPTSAAPAEPTSTARAETVSPAHAEPIDTARAELVEALPTEPTSTSQAEPEPTSPHAKNQKRSRRSRRAEARLRAAARHTEPTLAAAPEPEPALTTPVAAAPEPAALSAAEGTRREPSLTPATEAPATEAPATEALIGATSEATIAAPTESTPSTEATTEAPSPAPRRKRLLGITLTLTALAALAGLAAAWPTLWPQLSPTLTPLLDALAPWVAKPAVQGALALAAALLIWWLARRRAGPAPTPPQSHPWRWTFAITALVLGLLGQVAYLFRTELAVAAPALRGPLEAGCRLIGCTVPLPQAVEWISIEASDLHPIAGHDNRLQLLATLKNRAPYRQAWPHFEATLTDAQDRAVVRRVFTPAEYLPEELSAAPGFNANQELQIDLTLELAGASAAGYRVYVFYP